jgi:hypothetical protein
MPDMAAAFHRHTKIIGDEALSPLFITGTRRGFKISSCSVSLPTKRLFNFFCTSDVSAHSWQEHQGRVPTGREG